MTCADALDALAALEPGEAPFPTLREHLEACPDCRRKAGDFAALDALARRALPEVSARIRQRSPVLRWAAALLVAAVGLAVLWRKAEPPAAVPSLTSLPVAAFLEVAPGGDASLSGTTLVLRSGACWLDTKVAVEMTEPERVRFEAGSEAEIRILPAPKAAWSLLGEAWAGTPPEVLVSVVSGSARAGDVRIPAGSRARLVPGKPPVLESLDPAPIDAWRARRLETGKPGIERTLKDADYASFAGEDSFSAEVRAVQGYVVLRYPAGESTLGNLDAWKDGAWHRLGVTWRGSGTEIFLDGRRILKIPGASGTGIPGIGARGGSLVLREIRP